MRLKKSIAIGVVFLAGAALAALWITRAIRGSSTDPDALRRSLAAAVGPRRTLEPRLSGGFGWAPSSVVRSATARPALSVDLLLAAARIEAAYAKSIAPAERSLYGAALLVRGETERAIGVLTETAAAHPSAGAFSDLAAALLVRATDVDTLAALDAAQRAVALDPSSREAGFNRALALEAIGLRQKAIDAWRQYQNVDSGSPWASEAGEHAQRLERQAVPDPAAFAQQLDASLRASSSSIAPITAVIRANPGEARRIVEDVWLRRWAEETSAGRSPDAALGVAATLAAAHAALGDDAFLPAVTAAFRSVPRDRARRAAAGWLHYLEGRALNDAWQFGAARTALGRARAELEGSSREAARLAQLYLAIAEYQTGDVDAADSLIDPVVRFASERSYHHLLGRAAWMRAIVLSTRGAFSESLAGYQRAAAAFDRIDDAENLATVRSLIAEAMRTLGDVRGAWRSHHQVLRDMAFVRHPQRRQAIFYSAGYAAQHLGYGDAALQIFDGYLDAARQSGSPTALAEALLNRAGVQRTLGRVDALERDLDEAERLSGESIDQSRAPFIRARIQLERARSLPALPASRAAELATDALAAFESSRRAFLLPDVYLTRARARLRGGDDAGAEQDLLRGVRAFESHRLRVAGNAYRVTFFETGLDLYDSLVSLSLKRGDRSAALRWLDRSRVPSLAEQLRSDAHPAAAAPGAVARLLPPETTVLIFGRDGGRMFAWTIDHSGDRIVRLGVEPAALAREVSAWHRAAAEQATDGQLREVGARLYDIVLRPLGDLSGTRHLIVVPDDPLHLVPFAALLDRASGQFVVQRMSVLVTPGPSLIFPQPPQPSGTSALVIGAPEQDRARFGFLPPLQDAATEAVEVARTYPGAFSLSGSRATRGRFLAALPDADTLHFAGHAVVHQEFPEQSYLLLAGDGDSDGRVTVADLRKQALGRLRLVVLAACRTAVGIAYRGEGVIGLSRPFLEAGVPRVVATLWDVEDRSTAQVLTRFHHLLLRGGMPVEEALRQAQIEAIATRRIHAWAPFVTLGVGIQQTAAARRDGGGD